MSNRIGVQKVSVGRTSRNSVGIIKMKTSVELGEVVGMAVRAGAAHGAVRFRGPSLCYSKKYVGV